MKEMEDWEEETRSKRSQKKDQGPTKRPIGTEKRDNRDTEDCLPRNKRQRNTPWTPTYPHGPPAKVEQSQVSSKCPPSPPTPPLAPHSQRMKRVTTPPPPKPVAHESGKGPLTPKDPPAPLTAVQNRTHSSQPTPPDPAPKGLQGPPPAASRFASTDIRYRNANTVLMEAGRAVARRSNQDAKGGPGKPKPKGKPEKKTPGTRTKPQPDKKKGPKDPAHPPSTSGGAAGSRETKGQPTNAAKQPTPTPRPCQGKDHKGQVPIGRKNQVTVASKPGLGSKPTITTLSAMLNIKK